ncbi:MAG: Fe-S-containing hydro-lyase [Clostridiales bacterium]|nr:Fe-S-containing hydro-lyase [Clostridiales bacterium]
MSKKNINFPCDRDVVSSLKAGDQIQLTGFLYMARDAAHKKMLEEYEVNGKFPFDIKNQGIYYAGPAPAAPGKIIGPVGPTTSMRMDTFTPMLLDMGLSLMIGKGNRSSEVKNSIVKNSCVYMAATGGAAALISRCIKKQEIIAYKELGAEALRKIYIEDFPAIVIIDSNGNDFYEIGKAKYRKMEIKNA